MTEREISKFLFNHWSPDGKRNAAAKITLEYFECQNFNHLNVFLALSVFKYTPDLMFLKSLY